MKKLPDKEPTWICKHGVAHYENTHTWRDDQVCRLCLREAIQAE